MDAPPPILLIHGACHGSWCWEHLVPILSARGYQVHTIDLPGRQPSPAWGWRLRLKDQVAAVVAKAAKVGRPAVALAHSMGGIPMSGAAEVDPSLFERLVYLSAYIPSNGDKLITLGGQDKQSRVGEASRLAIARGFISVKPDAAGAIFYDDCSEAQVAWANGLLVKEPLRPVFDKVNLSVRFASISRSYIRCSLDQVITPGMQDAMITAWPCDKVATLASSHSPFLSMPDRLADAIDAVM